jgi:hypothetical protein
MTRVRASGRALTAGRGAPWAQARAAIPARAGTHHSGTPIILRAWPVVR